MAFRKTMICIAAVVLTALVFHAAIGAGSDEGGATSHAVSVNASGDEAASIPDFDGDGTIGFGDLLIFAAAFGSSRGDEKYNATYDLNDDGEIGFADLLIFAENFGRKAPSARTGGSGGDGSVENHRIALSFAVSENSLTAGQAFRLLTTVRHRNQTDETLYPLLYYYRSNDATVDWRTDAYIYNDYGRSIPSLNPSATRTASLDWLAPPYAGTYYYGVCVYIWGSLLCSSGVPVTVEGSEGGSPDLIVASLESSHSSLTPRAGFALSGTFENTGTGTATPTPWRYYLSTDATIDTTDTPIDGPGPGNISVLSRLGAGQTRRWTHHMSAPAEAGTYYYGVCIVPPLGETNISNNCSAGVPVTVVGGGSPDLIVAGPLIRDYRPNTGEFLILTPVVNIGEGLAAATTKRWYRSTDATIDATDTQIRATTVDFSLYAAYDLGGEYQETAPTTPGTYYYGACVDPVPGERDTNNNCSEGVPMNVGVPDLAVGLAYVSTSAPLTGQSFTLTATAKNQGPTRAGSTTLRYYRSHDATIDATDTPIGADNVGSLTGFDGLVSGPGSRLAASGTSRQSISVSAPSTPRTYYYGACADTVPGEANTDNNCSAGVYVRVVPSGADPFHIELVFLDDFADEHEDLFRQAARRWETIITEGLPDVDFSANPFRLDESNLVDDTVDDLRIFVRDDADAGVAGYAGPNYVRSGNPTGLPAVGGVSINSSYIENFQEHNGLRQEEHVLRNLMVHEIAHVLGMGPLWSNLGLLHDRSGDAYFSGERAIQAFNAAGGENYGGNKVPVELRGVSCGIPAHWRAEVFKGNERVFRAETMEPTIEEGHALSAITIQSIADLGYVVDVSRADPYRLPASVNFAQPPAAKAAAGHAFELEDLGPIYVGDEQGQIIRTIEP